MTTTRRMTWLPIERKYIEDLSAAGLQYVDNAIVDLARLWIAEKTPSRAELTISGYGHDTRELFEVPEVCQWANWIVAEIPVLPFFLTDTSFDCFVGWLCGPVSKADIVSKSFSEKFYDVKMNCMTKAIAESSEFLVRMGADQATISQFYFQIMANRAGKGQEEQKTFPSSGPITWQVRDSETSGLEHTHESDTAVNTGDSASEISSKPDLNHPAPERPSCFKRLFSRQKDKPQNNMNLDSNVSSSTNIPRVSLRLRTVADYIKLAGMRVEFTLRNNETFEGTVVDLSDTGTHIVLTDMLQVFTYDKNGLCHRETQPVERKTLALADISLAQVLDRHGKPMNG